MDTIKPMGRNAEAIRKAPELDETAHIDTASGEITDEFLLVAIQSGLLKAWAARFPLPATGSGNRNGGDLVAARPAGMYSPRKSAETSQGRFHLGLTARTYEFKF